MTRMRALATTTTVTPHTLPPRGPALSRTCLLTPLTTHPPPAWSTALTNAQAVLVVNTASLCGFTPQLGQLQELWTSKNQGKAKADGSQRLLVVAIPSNDFGEQEPWDAPKFLKFYEYVHVTGCVSLHTASPPQTQSGLQPGRTTASPSQFWPSTRLLAQRHTPSTGTHLPA